MRDKNGKTQVIALALVTAMCLLGDSMLYVALPIYWREAGLDSLWEVGVLLSVNRLVRVPLGPFIGKWYERTGGRSGLTIAVLLAFVTTASYGLQGFWLWLLMRCLWGVAWTFLRLGAYSLVVSVSDEGNRGHFMGLYNGLYRLGSLGGMLAGPLLAAWLGLRTTSFLLAGVSLLAFFLVCVFIPPSFTRQSGGTPPAAVRPSLRWTGSVALTMASGMFVAMCYQGMLASTLSRLIDLRQPFLVIGGMVVGSAVVAGVVQGARWVWEPWAAPWFGKWSDRCGRRRMLVGSLLAAAVLFGLTAAPLPFVLWLGVLMGIQLTGTGLTTVMDTLAADEASRQANGASLLTCYSVVTDLGAAVGPLLAFWADGRFGLNVLYVGTAGFLLAMAAGWSGMTGQAHEVKKQSA
jgi:MFS family permease